MTTLDLPFDSLTPAQAARFVAADAWLTDCWGCEYWSRDEQQFAVAEGWSLSIFADEDHELDRISRDKSSVDFRSDLEAVHYVTKRSQEGSPLHARALVLHMASVIKYGN